MQAEFRCRVRHRRTVGKLRRPDDVHALVVQAESDVRKRIADQAIEAETLQQSLRQAKAAMDKAKLDFAAQEIRTSIDQELLKLSVEEAEATYKELLQEVKMAAVRKLHALLTELGHPHVREGYGCVFGFIDIENGSRLTRITTAGDITLEGEYFPT